LTTTAERPSAKSFSIIATTTVGTTLAALADRSLGLGYAGGSSILLGLLLISLAAWYRSSGSVYVHTVTASKAEIFCWAWIVLIVAATWVCQQRPAEGVGH
jgi:uncharacterized membrane-anchored protein